MSDCAGLHRRRDRRFRFDLRFRALLGGHRSDVIQQIEEGFARLPSGCVIQLDRVASKIVLDNVKGSLGSSFAGLVAELRAMADGRRHAGGDSASISLADFLRDAALEPDDQATDARTAQRLLLDLARRLETEYPSAAESVREGLDETLTVLTLKLSPPAPLARDDERGRESH